MIERVRGYHGNLVANVSLSGQPDRGLAGQDAAFDITMVPDAENMPPTP